MLAAWEALEQILTPKLPKFIAALGAPASEATLGRLEATIAKRLPEDLRSFLALHDGQSFRLGDFIATHYLNSCEQIEKWWTFWYRPAAAGSSATPNYIDVPADRCFVEVTSSDGDAFLVALTTGAVYFHVRGDGAMAFTDPSRRASERFSRIWLNALSTGGQTSKTLARTTLRSGSTTTIRRTSWIAFLNSRGDLGLPHQRPTAVHPGLRRVIA